ncbi:MAG: glycosyltransferase [Thermodesulfovibrionales bacterium]|nr:glycosyltransferase [Thermodesulfovibrionales bacterium]
MQDYPHYEIIFSLQDHNDPAYKVAMKIKEKYPNRDITVLVKRCEAGLNPKVNNLLPAYEMARFEYILISDSDVFVDKNYLKEIMKYMEDPQVGLVSNVYWGVGGRGVGCIFDNIHLNSFVIGGVCFLDRFFKETWTFGGSMLTRKSDMESIGGLTALKDVLAEDVILRNKMKKMDKKIILSSYLIEKINEDRGFREYLNRLIRWGQLRWRIGGVRYFSELFTNSVFIAYLPILLWAPSTLTISFAIAVSSLKIIGNIYLDSLVRGERAYRTMRHEPRIVQFSLWWYLLSPLNDLLMGIIWFIPLFSNTVTWKGNSFRISKDSALSQYKR